MADESPATIPRATADGNTALIFHPTFRPLKHSEAAARRQRAKRAYHGRAICHLGTDEGLKSDGPQCGEECGEKLRYLV